MKSNIVGQKFARLLVLKQIAEKSIVRCDCGTVKTIETYSVSHGLTLSCGCLCRERASQASKTHGMSKSPEYNLWRAMKDRCNNPKNQDYLSYGGRGIKVCEQWDKSFSDFFSDMGFRPKGMMLERINNNGNYAPENVRWATPKEQSQNKRSNVLTPQLVNQIRFMWKRVGLKRCKISDILGVPRCSVSDVLNGHIWTNV